MIPKIIHYCWFGGNPIPEQYQLYISEWQSLHPDWTFKLWNEKAIAFDLPYLQNAAKHNNWAGISNLVRLIALETEGGIYLDTDIKLIKSLDNLCSNECFLGFESGDDPGNAIFTNNAVLGAVKDHPFIKKCIHYLLHHFDGSEKANESSPVMTTNILVQAYQLEHYGEQTLADGVKLYPKEYFYPVPWFLAKQLQHFKEFISDKTYAVHMWGRTWYTREMMLEMIDELQSWGYDQVTTINSIRKELEESIVHNDAILKRTFAQEKTIQEQKSKIDQLHHQLEEYRVTINKQHASLVQHENTIFQLNGKLGIAEERVKAVDIQLIEKTNSIRQLNTSIQLINRAYIKMEENISSFHNEITNLSAANEAMQKIIAKHSEEAKAYQDAINWYKRTYEDRKVIGIIKDKILKTLSIK